MTATSPDGAHRATADERSNRLPDACPGCGRIVDRHRLLAAFCVCDCGHHFRLPSELWIALLAEPDTWVERWDDLSPVDFLAWREPVPYPEIIRKASRRGRNEAVRVGSCRIGAHAVWLAVFDFLFLGGTLGVVAGERLALAMEHAAAAGQPFVLVVASGGARMQEGTLALMQMAKVNVAVHTLRDARVPYISIITDPTFGGTSASLALLADVNVAEPGGAIGFTGSRVIEQATHAVLPPRFQTAEFQLERGQLDMVVPRPRLRECVVRLLDLHADARRYARSAGPKLEVDRPRPADAGSPPGAAGTARQAANEPDGWRLVELARHQHRPYALDYIARWVGGHLLELHGDRLAGDDQALVGGLAHWDGVPTMFLAHRKGRTFAERVRCNFGMMHPEGYRKAIRLAALAARFRFPVVVLIDTPGAFPGAGAEERGIASAIGAAILEWFQIGTPVVAAVIGEGGSGGALGVAIADRVLMLEHAIYSVASPEAAASIVWRDTSHKEMAAAQLRLGPRHLHALGVVDTVVPEPPGGAHTDPRAAAWLLARALRHALGELRDVPVEELLGRRRQRFRRMGGQVLARGRLAGVGRSIESTQAV